MILGSGDIGLIMARRLTLEGAEVCCVLEKLPYCSGLSRNVRQCLTDYDIPLFCSTTVVDIQDGAHLTAVVAAAVDERGVPLPDTRRIIPCDTLILSVGLIPENELAKACGVEIDPVTGGALVDGRLMTSAPGVFSCGNGLHVHDIVDMVSEEAEAAARNAVDFARGMPVSAAQIPVSVEPAVRYALPRSVPSNTPLTLSLRVREPGRMQTVLVTRDGRPIAEKSLRRLSPAEMIRVPLPPLPAGAESLCVSLRQNEAPEPPAESELVCTICPNGCALLPVHSSDGTLTIAGALCNRGVSFGVAELTDPRRTLTTTVRVLGGHRPLVPVRSLAPVRKAELRELVRRLRAVRGEAPISCGDPIPTDIPGIAAAGLLLLKENRQKNFLFC